MKYGCAKEFKCECVSSPLILLFLSLSFQCTSRNPICWGSNLCLTYKVSWIFYSSPHYIIAHFTPLRNLGIYFTFIYVFYYLFIYNKFISFSTSYQHKFAFDIFFDLLDACFSFILTDIKFIIFLISII